MIAVKVNSITKPLSETYNRPSIQYVVRFFGIFGPPPPPPPPSLPRGVILPPPPPPPPPPLEPHQKEMYAPPLPPLFFFTIEKITHHPTPIHTPQHTKT